MIRVGGDFAALTLVLATAGEWHELYRVYHSAAPEEMTAAGFPAEPSEDDVDDFLDELVAVRPRGDVQGSS